MSVPNFRKGYHMGFEKNCRKSRLSKQFDNKPVIAENLYNRKLAPLNVEFVLIQGIQWYLIFENRSNGSKVVRVNKSPTLTRWWRSCGLVGDVELGVSGELTVLNECAKFQKKLPYGSRGCHRLQWHKNNNNTYNNNRFPPDGGTLIIIPTITIGFLLTEEP